MSGVRTHWLQIGQRRVPLLAGPQALAHLPRALAEAEFDGRLFVVADQVAHHPAAEGNQRVAPLHALVHEPIPDRAQLAQVLVGLLARDGEQWRLGED